MMGWEQPAGGKLHAYDTGRAIPVCGDESAKRSLLAERVMYVGPMPPTDDMICPTCKTWERDHDPRFIEGRDFERRHIRRVLSSEANRIYNKQEIDFPSNVLDRVSFNLGDGDEELTRPVK